MKARRRNGPKTKNWLPKKDDLRQIGKIVKKKGR